MHISYPKTTRYLAATGLVAAALFTQGCLGDDPVANNPGPQTRCATCGPNTPSNFSEQDERYVVLLERQGFDRKNIQPHPGGFLVEGDLFFSYERLEAEAALQKTTQRVDANRVDQGRVGSIRLQIHGTMSGWAGFVNQAVTNWNSVSSRVNISVVTSSPDIIIYGDTEPSLPDGYKNLSSNTCGIAGFPSGGRPFNIISINMDNGVLVGSDARKVRTITHEIGHTVGIHHTNQTGGSHLPETPTSDAISLMNGGECDIGALNLSPWDRMTTHMIYPRQWSDLGGFANDIGISSNNAAFVLGSNVIPNSNGGFGLWRWSGSAWTSFSGAGKRIDVDPSGNPWVIGGDGQPYQYNGSSWVNRTLTGASATDIGVGPNGAVFLIDNQTVPNSSGGFRIQRWTGSAWTVFSGAGKRIDVDANGRPWVIGGDGQPYQYNGSAWTKQTIPNAPAKDIAVSQNNAVYAVSSKSFAGSFQIYKFVGPGWGPVNGAGTMVSAGSVENPWTVSSTGKIYTY